MCAVEQAELHLLEGRDLRNELRAGPLPGRARCCEAVLDHPLTERLAADRRGILDAQPARDRGDVFGRGRRHDAIDHGRRERDLALDPGRKAVVAQSREGEHDGAQRPAVLGQIIAADDGQGTDSRLAAPLQPRDEQADRAARRFRVLEVMADLGVALVERAGCRVVAVALLGDGQRDHRCRRVGQTADDGCGILRRKQNLVYGAQDREPFRGGPALDHRVQALLRHEPLAHRGRAQRHAADAPWSGLGRQRVLCVAGLVRPVKVAEAEMDNADRQVLGRKRRPPHLGRKTGERGEPKARQ